MRDMTFGEKLGKLSTERGWKANELARRAGVSPSTVGRWLADERRPFDDSLLAVARLFGVRVEYLIDDAQEQPPGPSLTPDEERILWLVRAARLTADDVAAAVAGRRQGAASTGTVLQSRDPETGLPIDDAEKRRRGRA